MLSSDLSGITDQVRSESKKTAAQFDRLTLEQNRKIEDIQTAIARLEASLAVLDVSWLDKKKKKIWHS